MRTAGTIAAFAAFAAIAAPPFTAASHAAPITYQGVLEDGGVNADGMYDMVFTLADQPVGGLALQTVNVDDVVVSDGLFEVEIDFDDDHFDGSDRWIAITVEGSILSPRQKITYSVYSVRAGIADDLQTPWIKDVTTRVLDVRSDFDTAAVIDTGSGPAALTARHDDTGATAMLTTRDNVGVEGDATGIIGEGTGVLGTGQVSGVIGIAQTTTLSETGASLDRIGVSGSALSTADSKPVNMYGLHGIASNPPASFLIPRDAYGVYGEALRGGDSFSSAYGVYGKIGGPPLGVGFAGYFEGDVHVSGTLTKSNGAFMIDHPVDPENMYLSHSFVESPEMLNVYSGVVDLDDRGRAVVELPGYFSALNTDPRYQLTPIGAPMRDLHIEREIEGGDFVIAGGAPGARVSWEVSAVRQDPAAMAHPIEVEREKAVQHRGLYLNPEAYGFGEDRGIHTPRRD